MKIVAIFANSRLLSISTQCIDLPFELIKTHLTEKRLCLGAIIYFTIYLRVQVNFGPRACKFLKTILKLVTNDTYLLTYVHVYGFC